MDDELITPCGAACSDAQRAAWAALTAVEAKDALHVLTARGDILCLGELGDGWREYRVPPAIFEVQP